MELYYATTNKAKVDSLKHYLSGAGATGVEVLMYPKDVHEPRLDDVEAIADMKVLEGFREIRKPVISLDAGFYIPSLNGFPKVFVNFALQTIGIEGILKLLEEKKGQERAGIFKDCLAYMENGRQAPLHFYGKDPGMITTAPRGKVQKFHWSPLAAIFIPNGYDKTLAEMTEAEYHEWRAVSPYRTSASRNFAQWAKENLSS